MPQIYRDLLRGTNLTDVAEGEPHGVDAGTFNYYGYTTPHGYNVIMREKDDGTEYRFYINNGRLTTYSVNFADRQNKVYSTPDKFKP